MPHNVLERHPYLTAIDEHSFGSDYFKGLIIGTFPVFCITDTLTENNEIIERFDPENAHMRFFYGVKGNRFWDLLSNTYGEINPVNLVQNERVTSAKDLLVRNKLLITDVLQKTNRNEELSEDSNLWVDTNNAFVLNNRSINHNIDDLLLRNSSIQFLYFTATGLNANSPFGWFIQLFGHRIQYQIVQQVQNRVVSANIQIDGRHYIGFFLPSPAGKGTRGLHFNIQRTMMFVNYIISIAPNVFLELDPVAEAHRTPAQKAQLTRLRNSFLFECWQQAFVYHNVDFNGSV